MVALLRRDALGLGGVLGRVDVEERDRTGRPASRRWRRRGGRSRPRSCADPPRPARGADRSRRPTGHRPTTGCRHSPERAQASGGRPPCAPAAAAQPDRAAETDNRPARSRRRSISGAFAAAQSSPARMPASGPAKSGTLSATTGRPVSAKRAGSPLALRMIEPHCGASRASTRSRMVAPPIRMRALSPPPMRRASPPASTRPRIDGSPMAPSYGYHRGGCSVIMHRRLAPVLGAFLLDDRRGPGRTRCGPRRRARRSACRARGRSA